MFASSMLNSKIRTFPIRSDDVVYDDAVDCLAGSGGEGEGGQGSAEESADMEDFLAEIRAEEEEKQRKLEEEAGIKPAATGKTKA